MAIVPARPVTLLQGFFGLCGTRSPTDYHTSKKQQFLTMHFSYTSKLMTNEVVMMTAILKAEKLRYCMMHDPVSPNRLVAGTKETHKFPKFQCSVQELDYHVDSIHCVMPTLLSREAL